MISIEHFKLAHYRFTFRPKDIIIMPETGKGNIIRGAFGSTLKRLSCVNQYSKDCMGCEQKTTCPYHLIFNPTGIITQKRFKNPPRGFIVKPPLEKDTKYTAEKPFIFDMVLVGKLVEYIPWLIIAFNQLGGHGIGKNRGKFELSGIELIINGRKQSLYDSNTRMYTGHNEFIAGEKIIQKASKFSVDRIVFEFLTPTRIKFNPTEKKGGSIIIQEPEFHHIIRRLLSRVSALSVTYLDKEMEIDYKGLIEQAMKIKKSETNIEWVELKRKSRTALDRFKQHAKHDQSGFTGSIVFEGDLSVFLPVIFLGEYIHVGEDTVFGNGWYRIIN